MVLLQGSPFTILSQSVLQYDVLVSYDSTWITACDYRIRWASWDPVETALVQDSRQHYFHEASLTVPSTSNADTHWNCQIWTPLQKYNIKLALWKLMTIPINQVNMLFNSFATLSLSAVFMSTHLSFKFSSVLSSRLFPFSNELNFFSRYSTNIAVSLTNKLFFVKVYTQIVFNTL